MTSPRPDDTRSPYLQIVEDLRRSIVTGTIGPGEKLPTNAELKRRYKVASQTAQNAINTLKSEGLVYGVAGRGVFVRSDLDTERLAGNAAASEHGTDFEQRVLQRLDALADRVTTIEHRLDSVERSDDTAVRGAGRSA
ncbi:MAG: winged helix-turn-helix domain-containing protein [Actinomycetota bacterium]